MAVSEMDQDERDKAQRRSTEKDALLELIAQEMVTSLLNAGSGGGDDDDDDDEKILTHLQAKLMEREKARRLKRKARRKSKARINPEMTDLSSPTPTAKSSVEDIYYSQMSGTSIRRGPPSMPPTPTEVLSPGDDVYVTLKDHDDDSFAGGELHELVDEKHRRGSLEQTSSKASGGSTGSHEGTTKSTATSSRDNSIQSKELSMDQIRQYVLENIPAAIRDQIPPEAWKQLFNPESLASKTASQESSLKGSDKIEKKATAPLEEIAIDEEDDDNLSVFSDVSGLTGAFPDGKGVETKREILNHATQILSKVDETGSQSSQISNSFRAERQAPEAPGEKDYIPFKDSKPQNRREVPATLTAPTKKVTWNQVEVRYYERIVTDNPAVQSGPAIGIGWKYKRGGRVHVDYWEKSRGPPRLSPELVLPRQVRERLLREAGVPQKDIADMVRATLKVKNQRKQTVNNLPTAGIEEAVEKTRRRFTKIISLGRNKGL